MLHKALKKIRSVIRLYDLTTLLAVDLWGAHLSLFGHAAPNETVWAMRPGSREVTLLGDVLCECTCSCLHYDNVLTSR